MVPSMPSLRPIRTFRPIPTPGRVLAVVAALPLLVLSTAPPAGALRLTFDPVPENFSPVDQAYGDRVVATPQDGFEYGTEMGFTPNVTVDYGPLPAARPDLWTTDYGDLVNVLYEENDGYGHLEIGIRADPAWRVELHSFDLAAWSVVGPMDGLQVQRGDGEVLFAETDVVVPHVGHLHYEFDPPLVGSALVIVIDSGNLGSHSDDIGIDNIVFGQAVDPVPVQSAGWGQVKARYRP